MCRLCPALKARAYFRGIFVEVTCNLGKRYQTNLSKDQRSLHLLVEDMVLLIDISDVSSILIRTLSGELAPLVDASKVGDQ